MGASFIFYSSFFFFLSRIYRIAYSAVATKNRYSIEDITEIKNRFATLLLLFAV